mgnify:CR=1 FL=1
MRTLERRDVIGHGWAGYRRQITRALEQRSGRPWRLVRTRRGQALLTAPEDRLEVGFLASHPILTDEDRATLGELMAFGGPAPDDGLPITRNAAMARARGVTP